MRSLSPVLCDDPLHGHQEGRFFHGYHDCYCYPAAMCSAAGISWRPSCGAPTSTPLGAVDEVARLVGQIRTRWPRVKIILRADSGFAREALMAWCEANGVDYVFGLARNERLEGRIAAALSEARRLSEAAGRPGRRGRAGRAGAASSPRPSGRAARPIPASSSPR
jgi:hypothetical protein